MILNLNKPLYELEILSQLATIPKLTLPLYSTVKHRFKTYRFTTDFSTVTFEKFMLIAKYSNQLNYCSRFISEVSGVPTEKIKRLPIGKMMGLYYFYESEFLKCMEFFKNQKDLVVSKEPVSLYDFEEFGLSQIIRFLSEGDRIKYEKYLSTPIYAVMTDYRFKIKQIENYNYSLEKQRQ